MKVLTNKEDIVGTCRSYMCQKQNHNVCVQENVSGPCCSDKSQRVLQHTRDICLILGSVPFCGFGQDVIFLGAIYQVVQWGNGDFLGLIGKMLVWG